MKKKFFTVEERIAYYTFMKSQAERSIERLLEQYAQEGFDALNVPSRGRKINYEKKRNKR